MVSRSYGIYKSALHIGDIEEGLIRGLDLFSGEFSGFGQGTLTGSVEFDIAQGPSLRLFVTLPGLLPGQPPPAPNKAVAVPSQKHKQESYI